MGRKDGRWAESWMPAQTSLFIWSVNSCTGEEGEIGCPEKMVNWRDFVGLEGVNPHNQWQLVGGGILIFALMTITVRAFRWGE